MIVQSQSSIDAHLRLNKGTSLYNTIGKDFLLQSDRIPRSRTRPGIKGKSLIDFDPLLQKEKSCNSNEDERAAKTSDKKSWNCYEENSNYDYDSDLHLFLSSQVLANYQSKLSKKRNNSNSNIEEHEKKQHAKENNDVSKKKKNQHKHRRNKSLTLPAVSYEWLQNNNSSIDNNTKYSSNHVKKLKRLTLYHSLSDYSIFKKKKGNNSNNKILGDRTNDNNSTSAAFSSSLTTKTSPTSFLTGTEKVVTMMNTMEPSFFKLEMPGLEEFLFNIRLCQFMEDYRKEGILDIDLQGALAGIPRSHLQTFLSIGKLPCSSSYNQRLVDDTYKPIIKSLIKCADDVQLSYHTTERKQSHPKMTTDGSSSSSSNSGTINNSKSSSTIDDRSSTSDCSEVAIFQRQRQFVVVFKGTPSQQQKGGVNALFSSTNNTKKCKMMFVPFLKNSSPLSSSLNEPQIYSCFRDAYMYTEKRIMQHLDNLVEENPFCDVVFTGHSFGGAIAQIAAVRYAIARSVIRVSCHVFGSPKVGNIGFANLANYSLPNLKIVRVEYKNDHTCQIPSSTTTMSSALNRVEGYHIGHLVAINKSIDNISNNSNKEDRKVVRTEDNELNKESSIVFAYKFNKGNSNNNRRSIASFVSSRKKKNRGIEEYVAVLEGIESSGIPWPKDYEGENVGEGVRGNNNEARTLA